MSAIIRHSDNCVWAGPDPTCPRCTARRSGRPYSITLTEEEYEGLNYIAGRYDWAKDLLGGLEPEYAADGERVVEYSLSESEVWDFVEAVEAEDGRLPLAGPELAEKIECLIREVI